MIAALSGHARRAPCSRYSTTLICIARARSGLLPRGPLERVDHTKLRGLCHASGPGADSRRAGVVRGLEPAVLLAGDGGAPAGVGEVPAHGLGELDVEHGRARPAEGARGLGAVDRVAEVVALAIDDE